MERAVWEFVQTTENSLGIVSPDVPLISNLDCWLNVALIKQYHENMPKNVSYLLVIEYLKRFQLERIAHMRPSILNARESFLVKLLRACMVRDVRLVIDRPSHMLPGEKDWFFLMQQLRLAEDIYRDCHIFDLSQWEDRYQTAYGKQN